MTQIEIESWALRVLSVIQAGGTFEDSRVELKAKFPADPTKAARRIAAHANSAMGSPILWLIGVEQKVGVVGTNPADLADWFARVKSEFDGVYPSLCDLVVHIGGTVVLALQFETSRAPYLVKNASGGMIQREVPWREGTHTRTATREELLMLLQPDSPLPEFEVMNAAIEARRRTPADRTVSGSMEVYVVPCGTDRVVFPFHRCSGKIICGGRVLLEKMEVRCFASDPGPMGFINDYLLARRRPKTPVVNVQSDFKPVEVADGQIILSRPARIHITATGVLQDNAPVALFEPTLEITLGLAQGHRRHCVLTAQLGLPNPDGSAQGDSVEWKL